MICGDSPLLDVLLDDGNATRGDLVTAVEGGVGDRPLGKGTSEHPLRLRWRSVC